MRLLLNLIWLVLSGFWMALGYVFAGVVMCVLVVTIPFALLIFKLAGYALWPFGRSVVRRPSAGIGTTLGNMIWFLFGGLGWLALGASGSTAVLLAVTVIGIPFAVANIELIQSRCTRSATTS